ncbi:MAG TPA: DUF2304 domain-containing protein [Gemmatales bacterium]|nr:DUF2304 domain-containing protein [Gemmatales bacterium]HMP58064.1 DUF2304 domain-containing protein [Gemmatales bacterium]
MPPDAAATWFPRLTAETLMLAGGIGAFVLTIYLVRSRELREKYAVTWIGVALLLLVAGFFPGLLKWAAEQSRLSYPAAVLFLALGMIYIFSFSVSLSLTRQYRRNIRLMQEQALLDYRLRRLERNQAPTEVKL